MQGKKSDKAVDLAEWFKGLSGEVLAGFVSRMVSDGLISMVDEMAFPTERFLVAYMKHHSVATERGDLDAVSKAVGLGYREVLGSRKRSREDEYVAFQVLMDVMRGINFFPLRREKGGA